MARARFARRPLLCLLATLVAAAGCATAPSRPAPSQPAPPVAARPVVTLDALAIPVSRAENRPVAFTNREAAYFYTQTHRNDHPEHAWFRGLNIAGRRVFSDYRVVVGDAPLDPETARVVVRPDALVRRYPNGATETLRLFDGHDVVEVEVTGLAAADAARTELRLSGDQLRVAGREGGLTRYVSSSGTDTSSTDHLAVGRQGNRFLVAVAPSRAAAAALFARAAAEGPRWTAERRARLLGLVTGDRYLRTDDARLTDALRWITLTTDVLVTRQRGDGIYAGLPWFNEYWGRDTFISLAGAALVTGRFAEARAIITSFARFQELDRASPFYGRLPNIVKPGSTDYHTTDGTPRWVIALRDYVRYTGDRSAVAALYPNVRASIEGSFARHTDSAGYLVHADNETWMDARREPDKASYSPRSTRANDIQALWYAQLRAGAEFATSLGDTAAAARWTRAADRLRARFARDFVDAATGRVADRLDARGAADYTLRPNLLFALDLVDDERAAARATRRAWEALVYPWGVATLDQRDPFFHPYHLAWEHYHKDEAYHNGTVWPWLNGIAMQRVIAAGRPDLAWPLFRNTNAMALDRGSVGGLAETLDAYPQPGDTLPRLTGTFLQGWSNAEQLRVWYQDFLGVHPDLGRGVVRLAPRLPAALGAVDFSAPVGTGVLHGMYARADAHRRYAWRLTGAAAALLLDVAPYAVHRFAAAPGDALEAEVRADGLHARLVSAGGAERARVVLPPAPARLARQAMLDSVLAGTTFAAPGRAEAHPVMRQRYRRPGE